MECRVLSISGVLSGRFAQFTGFDVLWIKRSPKLKLELRYNLDAVLFEEQDQLWRTEGYYLESATRYLDAGQVRYAGLWVQHEPYLRWTEGIAIDPNDPIYIEQYLPLHERAIQQMTLAGEAKAGEYFRPSTTLHLFKGDGVRGQLRWLGLWRRLV